MNKLTHFILKYPVKLLIMTFILLIVLVVGIAQIKLKTGNDTLISDSSTIYQNNEAYQSEFGKDPIILIFDQETTFDQQTLTLMHLVQ